MENEIVEKFIISKEDFKKYFNCKKIINKEELRQYYKEKNANDFNAIFNATRR